MLEPSNNFMNRAMPMQGNRSGNNLGNRLQKPPNEQQVPMHTPQGIPMQAGGFMPPGQAMMKNQGMGNMGNQSMGGINPSQGFWQQMFPQILQMMQQQGGNQNQMGMKQMNPMANTSGTMRKTMTGY